MQLFTGELALANLKGDIDPDERGYRSKEVALMLLRELSGKDFGEDIKAWEAWVSEYYSDVPDKSKCD